MRSFKSVSGHIRRSANRDRAKRATKERSEVLNLIGVQFTALREYIDIQCFLRDGVRIGSMTGFPVAPDIASWIANEIHAGKYTAYVEFGSGVSTAIAAAAFKSKSAEVAGSNKLRCLSFEHDDRYFEATSRLLSQLGLSEYVDLVLAPLVDAVHGSYPISRFYGGVQESMERLASYPGIGNGPLLIFVDGPPGSASKFSRLSAMFMVHQAFRGRELKVVLDDANRDAELSIADYWVDYLNAQGADFSVLNLGTERGAKVFTIR